MVLHALKGTRKPSGKCSFIGDVRISPLTQKILVCPKGLRGNILLPTPSRGRERRGGEVPRLFPTALILSR